MAKNTPSVPPPPPAEKSFWLPFALSGILGLLAGGTGTYLALQPRLRTPAAPVGAPVATQPDDPTQHLPSPELTAGQPPAQAARTLGNFYYDHQNWASAVKEYESAIRLGSDDADIRTDLGNAYRFSGRPPDALAQYQLAQKMNSAHEFSLFNQGGLYLEDLKDPAKAVAAWNEYLVRFPQGQNATAARQLIAQAQGGAPAPGLPAAGPATAAPSTSEDLILQRLKSAQTRSGKP